VLVDDGVVTVADQEVKQHELGYLPPGSSTLTLSSPGRPTRLLLFGGEPLRESIVMWWNFVGRSHEEIVGFREEWQQQVLDREGEVRDPDDAGGLHENDEAQRVVPHGQQVRPGRFGVVTGDHLAPIPAPALPNARLRGR
jgi:hypothetical protein